MKKFNDITSLSISNTQTVKKLKSILKDKKRDCPEKIRLFFGGKELKDEDKLFIYITDDDCCIQMQ